MVFSSILFTFLFLPIVIILYFLAKKPLKNYILLIAILLFYSYGEPKFVFIMIASIIMNYVLAILIDKNKSSKAATRIFLILSVILNVGILYIFKYLDFSIAVLNKLIGTNLQIFEIALPIGISFFTFQALSYVIDVYRGTVKAQKNPLYLALYISFFPQLIAGPIVRYSTIEDQLINRQNTLELFSDGTRRFMLGFCKKIILANNLSVVATDVFRQDATTANPLLLWLGAICYSLQIFYDFSGYSDMAIGLGKIFGFQFNENFNYPYISKSITDFWRRWHISLSSWFKDYVYIPLGGSKRSTSRNILNLLVVWLLTGFWHGANYTFIAWGLFYFVLLVIEKYIIKPSQRSSAFSFFWQIFSLICINFGWVIFNSATLRSGINYCLGMIGIYGNDYAFDSQIAYYLREYGAFLLLGILFSTPIAKKVEEKLRSSSHLQIVTYIVPFAYGFAFLWSVSFLILGAHNPFIYFNF